MGEIRNAVKVKVFCGMIYSRQEHVEEVRSLLSQYFGPIEDEAGPFPFDSTGYYKDEMGTGLQRRFFSFRDIIIPENMSEWKLLTNSIEEKFFQQGSRQRMVNLDPGYLTSATVVLLSTKNYSHRIYIGKRIYAEVTFLFAKGKFVSLPWTYPDYKTREYLCFFEKMRDSYKRHLQ